MTQKEILDKQANGMSKALRIPVKQMTVGEAMNKIQFLVGFYRHYKYEDRKKANQGLNTIKALLDAESPFKHALRHMVGHFTTKIAHGNVWLLKDNEIYMCIRKDEARKTETLTHRLSFFSKKDWKEFAECVKCTHELVK